MISEMFKETGFSNVKGDLLSGLLIALAISFLYPLKIEPA
jgi:hypothetical protein